MGFGTVKGFPGLPFTVGKFTATLKGQTGTSVALPLAMSTPNLSAQAGNSVALPLGMFTPTLTT